MRFKPLKSLHLILSLSKDEAKISCFFSILLSCSLKSLDAVHILAAPALIFKETPKAGGGTKTTVEQALMRGLDTA